MRPPRLLRRIVHSLDNHGWRGTVRRLVSRQRDAKDCGPADFITPVGPHPFDLRHGTDTGGYVPGEALQSGHAAADFCNTAYYAISPSTLRAALSQLPIDPQGYTFVDVGCGKGRALLVAAELGFRSVLGVEIAPALCLAAQRNAAPYPEVEVLQQDASRLRYPAGPLIVFLYHPFLAPLLRRVLRNLRQQLGEAPRPCYVLYANPTYAPLVARVAARPVWDRAFPLSPEDAAADRHGTLDERYALWQICA